MGAGSAGTASSGIACWRRGGEPDRPGALRRGDRLSRSAHLAGVQPGRHRGDDWCGALDSLAGGPHPGDSAAPGCSMRPILFQIGPFPISSFGLFLLLAFVVSIALARRRAAPLGIDPSQMLDIALYMIIGGIVVGRLGYVVANLP